MHRAWNTPPERQLIEEDREEKSGMGRQGARVKSENCGQSFEVIYPHHVKLHFKQARQVHRLRHYPLAYLQNLDNGFGISWVSQKRNAKIAEIVCGGSPCL